MQVILWRLLPEAVETILMQVSHSLIPIPSLAASLEQQRSAASQFVQPLPLASQVSGTESTLRSVENVKQAEKYLHRHQSERQLTQVRDDPRSQQAVTSYQSVQAAHERDYVSEVLGIDVYA
ncbi:MAG: hypothetical protein ABW139_00460 [Candidatus Thiodiazotropha sp. DIVDIV]